MKKITGLLGLAAILIFGTKGYAQFSMTWDAQYQHTAQPNYSNEGRKIIEDPTGNVFVLADVTSDIDPFGLHGATTWHYVVVTKYSANGAVLASLEIEVGDHLVSGTYNLIGAFGLDVDAGGNIFIGYVYWDAVDGFQVALGKYDNNLIRVWTNTYGSSGTDSGVEMKLHPNGTLYAVVKSSGLNTSYTIINSVPTSGPADVLYSFAPNAETINAIALDGGQMAYVTGYKLKSTYKNVYIGAINVNTGNLSWSTFYTNVNLAGDDEGNKITVGADGGIYTVGTTFVGGNYGDQVLVLKNFPGTPHFNFIAELKGPENNHGLFINADEAGWIYVASASPSSATVFRIPDDGIFTVPGQEDYYPIPGSAFNSINSITLNSMQVSGNKNIYITGGVNASGPSGDFTSSFLYRTAVVFGNALVRDGGLAVDGDFDRNNEGMDICLDYGKIDVYFMRNYWDDTHATEIVEIIDLNAPSPLRKTSISSNEFQLMPNPSRGSVMITSRSQINEVELIDITGKVVLETKNNSMNMLLNLDGIAPGIYICKAQTDIGQFVSKLIVE